MIDAAETAVHGLRASRTFSPPGVLTGVKPDLDDGVQITAAPLWKLFRLPKWQKTLKETWQKPFFFPIFGC